ncbi:DUF3592 domain-containing protein [Streptomyces sp. NPDC023723]|uniref:DUF3592 domain-containing protein n=1 Tax=Streptomyces sp. NPDC023723 TaxID=3154323 RepID=UPI0033CB8E63
MVRREFMHHVYLASDGSVGYRWSYAIGVLWIGIGVWGSVREVMKRRRRVEVSGQCVSSRYVADDVYHVSFQAIPDSRIEVFKKEKRARFKEGAKVTISYDPKDRSDAELAGDRSAFDPWKGILFISPIGIFIILVLWLSFRTLQS